MHRGLLLGAASGKASLRDVMNTVQMIEFLDQSTDRILGVSGSQAN
jgi:hypothetical protein